MSERLTVKQKLGFGIFDLGGNMLFTLMSFWALKYLTDTVGLAAALAGAAVMIGKAWDAVSDPMMGFISDRTLSRWGRRRVYLLFGAVPMLLSMAFFFTAPQYLPSSMHLLWAIAALILLNTVATILNVPYSSLTPELTKDYNEQSSLNGYRFGCAVFGTIAGAGAVEPLVHIFARPGSLDPLVDPRGFSAMGIILGAIMMTVTLITFFGTKEKQYRKEDLPKESFFSTYSAVFHNKPFVILLATYALHITGISFLTTILAFYTTNVLNRPDITTIALLLLLLTAMICIPISVLVSKKIGKMRTYQICFAVLASACAVIFTLGHRLPVEFFFALMVYAGIGVGFSYVAPFAMVPDTIKYDADKTGKRTEGAYYGMWTFTSKLGAAIAIFFAGLILEWGGYISQAGETAVQPDTVFNAIRLIIGPIPVAILIAAIVMINFYPLDKKEFRGNENS
ncbi:MAG: glycoside-pentoside-hexuronide (GPH):cation symporter [Treponema sp.]|nr:glycoside-pentoside-hexuronide (GPH):cation symporter [Treponema sp.]